MGNCQGAEAQGGCCVLIWAGFDIAFGIIGMVMSIVVMVLSVGLRVQPFGGLAFPLLFAGLLTTISASMVTCCQFRHKCVPGVAVFAALLAFISLCLLGGDHTPCAQATCADWWNELGGDEDRRRRLENDGDLWALTNGGHICGNDGSGPKLWGTWYDQDFDDREEDDHAWWGFDKEETCEDYCDEAGLDGVEGLMVILTVFGALPLLICNVGMAFTLLRAKPPAAAPAAQIAPTANIQMIPAQNVQMVPATNVQMVPAQPVAAPNVEGTAAPPAQENPILEPAKAM